MEEKRRMNWKRTLKNNGYMIGLIMKVCPGVFVLGMISTILGAAHSFFLNTYLYKYALNALQEGKEWKTVLITLVCMFAYSIFYEIFCCVADRYFEIKHPVVESYIQNLLQKKASTVDLACFENSAFYDTYVKAADAATDRAYAVMNNISSGVWIVINMIAVGTLIVVPKQASIKSKGTSI